MRFDDTDWIDGFDSWEEVWTLLQEDWRRIEDEEQRLRLDREDDELLVVEVDRHLRARQRRDLHRMGFRPVAAARVTVWQWNVQEALQGIALEEFSTSFERVFDFWSPEARTAKIEQHRTRLARAHLMTQQIQRVVKEVFRSRPEDLSVTLVREDEGWDEEWGVDEDLQRPTG